MARASLACALCLLAWPGLRAEPGGLREAPVASFQPIAEGLERAQLRLQRSAGGPGIELHAFRVDPARFRFRVVRAADGKRDTVHAIARAHGLALAVNASYFDPRGRPLGLIIDRGKRSQKVRKIDGGIFYVKGDGVAGIVHRRDWSGEGVDAAVQAFPRLVVDGRPLDLKPQIARRTAVCVDRKGRVVLLVSEGGVLLQDLADLLARPASSGGFGCVDALNLDGGGSTQATLFLQGARWDLYGGTSVPVVLGIEPRR